MLHCFDVPSLWCSCSRCSRSTAGLLLRFISWLAAWIVSCRFSTVFFSALPSHRPEILQDIGVLQGTNQIARTEIRRSDGLWYTVVAATMNNALRRIQANAVAHGHKHRILCLRGRTNTATPDGSRSADDVKRRAWSRQVLLGQILDVRSCDSVELNRNKVTGDSKPRVTKREGSFCQRQSWACQAIHPDGTQDRILGSGSTLGRRPR